MDPDYGSGSNIGGLGLVFILGVAVIGLGIVIMICAGHQTPCLLPRRDPVARRTRQRAPAKR